MKVSIIVCTFNSAKRLPKTLDSLLAQPFDAYEVVIVDGASTDETLEVIKAYENKFNRRLRWISEKDSGIYEAMNKGIAMAQGEFVVFIGAGDWLEKDALEKASKCIDKNPEADAVFGKTRIWNADLKNSRLVQTGPEYLPCHPMQHPSLFYRKSLHDKFGLYDESYRIAADYAFCLKAFYDGGAMVSAIDAVISNFVTDGMSSKNNFRVLRENMRARKEFGLKTNFLREIKFYIKGLLK